MLSWQKRGIGVLWTEMEKEGFNKLTKTSTTTIRHELITDFELPLKNEYASFIESIF